MKFAFLILITAVVTCIANFIIEKGGLAKKPAWCETAVTFSD